MILMLQLLAAIAAVIVSLTAISLLNDQPRRLEGVTLACWVRHHGRRFGLVLMGAGAAMVLLSVVTGQPIALEVLVLICAIALRQVSHPKGWAAFVRRGQEAQRA